MNIVPSNEILVQLAPFIEGRQRMTAHVNLQEAEGGAGISLVMRADEAGGPATEIGDEVFFVGEHQVWKRAVEITETVLSEWIGYHYQGNEPVLQFLEIQRKAGPIGTGKDRIASEAVIVP